MPAFEAYGATLASWVAGDVGAVQARVVELTLGGVDQVGQRGAGPDGLAAAMSEGGRGEHLMPGRQGRNQIVPGPS